MQCPVSLKSLLLIPALLISISLTAGSVEAQQFDYVDIGLTGVEDGSVSVADIDNQNGPDILVTGRDENGNPSTRLYLQQSDDSFSLAQNTGLDNFRLSDSEIADVNGDGKLDILIVGMLATVQKTTLYLQQNNGSFSPANAQLRDGQVNQTCDIADIDGQNGPDILLTGGGYTELYLQQSDGSFSEANENFIGVADGATSIADVDGQNGPDIFITGYTGAAGPNNESYLYLQQSDGTFSKASEDFEALTDGSASISDVDGKNGPDLLLTGEPSTSTLYLQQSDGSFSTAGASLTDVGFSSSLIADIDGENGPDLLITGRDKDDQHTATLYLQQSDGGFSPANKGLMGVENTRSPNGSSAVSDLDEDGDADLLITGTNQQGNKTARFYTNGSTPLPVELVSFQANVNGDGVQLTWHTASETNNTGFRVQRKSPDGTWTALGFVEGAGTTAEARSYRFSDANLPYEADRLTYRLKQLDTDGTAHYSKQIMVRRAVQRVRLRTIYPNPTRQHATVRYAVPDAKSKRKSTDATLRLYDVLGRQVRSVDTDGTPGRHERQVKVAGLASGVYVLRLTVNGSTRTKKLTIAR